METLDICMTARKPLAAVIHGSTRPSHIAAWILEYDVRTLNVSGDRENWSPGVGVRVERFLAEVFRQLRALEGEAPHAKSP
jgi:putative molybdenum carrier protein